MFGVVTDQQEAVGILESIFTSFYEVQISGMQMQTTNAKTGLGNKKYFIA